jgi:hypothetical protein
MLPSPSFFACPFAWVDQIEVFGEVVDCLWEGFLLRQSCPDSSRVVRGGIACNKRDRRKHLRNFSCEL